MRKEGRAASGLTRWGFYEQHATRSFGWVLDPKRRCDAVYTVMKTSGGDLVSRGRTQPAPVALHWGRASLHCQDLGHMCARVHR